MEPASSWEFTAAAAASRPGVKWGRHGPDVLSAWVADMDFAPPTVATDAMRELIDANALGYPDGANDKLCAAWIDWQTRRFGWTPDQTQTRPFTTVVHALEAVLSFATEPGDGVAVFMPVYHPFLNAIRDSGRRRVEVALDPAGWRLDPERLEAAIDDGTSTILLCQPHNPTGRMFDDTEIAAIADIAERRDLLVLSDEIWGDITHARTHRPLASVDERFARRIITFASASKTFNLAGTRCSMAHIDYAPFSDWLATLPPRTMGELNSLGIAAAIAAWRDGEPWLDETLGQIRSRFDHLAARLSVEAPHIGFEIPEATYLAWLDFRQTPLADEPTEQLLDKANLALSPGSQFGAGGDGWARVNVATSHDILDQIIDRIVAAVT